MQTPNGCTILIIIDVKLMWFCLICARADKPVQLVPVPAAGGGGLPEAAGSEGGGGGIRARRSAG